MKTRIGKSPSIFSNRLFVKAKSQKPERDIYPVGFSESFHRVSVFAFVLAQLVVPVNHLGNLVRPILSARFVQVIFDMLDGRLLRVECAVGPNADVVKHGGDGVFFAVFRFVVHEQAV